MRFAFVPIVLAITSFALAAPAPTVDRSASYYKIDTERRGPPPSPVYIVNLPATQPVSGTVNVGNLPLTDDGALRVASAPARQIVMMDLLAQPLVLTDIGNVIVGTVDTRGYSAISYWVQVSGDFPVEVDTQWRWADEEPFAYLADFRFPLSDICGSMSLDSTHRATCQVSASQAQIALRSFRVPQTVTSLRIYLIP